MFSEDVIHILVLNHVIFGGIALLTGLISLVAKKGGFTHRKSGIVFAITMTVSAFLGMFVSVQPNHTSPFLFSVGVFSAYFVISGYLALRYTRREYSLVPDRIVSGTMLVIGLGMVLHPLFLGFINIVMLIFGSVGLMFAVRDFRFYRNRATLKSKSLVLHIEKITGGYIAAVTAFVVVNQFLPGIIGWIAPGVIGGFFIAYWTRKVSPKK